MARRSEPGAHDRDRCDRRRRLPEDVLADLPAAEAATAVEALDPAPERRPVGGVVVEEAGCPMFAECRRAEAVNAAVERSGRRPRAARTRLSSATTLPLSTAWAWVAPGRSGKGEGGARATPGVAAAAGVPNTTKRTSTSVVLRDMRGTSRSVICGLRSRCAATAGSKRLRRRNSLLFDESGARRVQHLSATCTNIAQHAESASSEAPRAPVGAWVSGLTRLMILATLPSASITKVERSTPVEGLAVHRFSPQTPYCRRPGDRGRRAA